MAISIVPNIVDIDIDISLTPVVQVHEARDLHGPPRLPVRQLVGRLRLAPAGVTRLLRLPHHRHLHQQAHRAGRLGHQAEVRELPAAVRPAELSQGRAD